MATGWSASDVSGGWSVSGTGNTVVTLTTAGAIRSATSHATGKWYFEFAVGAVTDGNLTVGIASTSPAIGGVYPGFPAPSDSVGMAIHDNQEIFYNNSTVGGEPGGAAPLGTVVSVCVDAGAGLIWFIDAAYISGFGANAWNCSPTANPASGIGGISYSLTAAAAIAAGTTGGPGGPTITLNTGQSAFLRAPPSGFSAWDNWGTQQAGSALTFGAGALVATPRLRAVASPASWLGAGQFAAGTLAKQQGTATFAGAGSLFATRNQAALASALSVTAGDTASALLAGQVAQLVATGTSSSDQGVGFLSLPSILAATQQLQNALVDALFRGQPLQAPSTWYVALVTQLGSPTIPGFEVVAGDYARASISASLAAWSGTQGVGTTTLSAGTSDTTSNNINILFGAPASDWGTVIGYELWDAPAGGNRWLSGKLASPVTISNGGPARRFAAGALTIAIG